MKYLAAFVCFYLFFYEYLKPVERVQITYDLEAFHYPLDNLHSRRSWAFCPFC